MLYEYECFVFLAPVNEIAKAYINCSHAGKGELTANVVAEGTNVLAPLAIKDNEDETYDVTYSVPSAATYVLDVKYGHEHIPGSPFTVTGYSKADPTQVGEFISSSFLPYQ